MAYDEIQQSITLNADSSLASLTGVAGLPGAPGNPSGFQYRLVKFTGEHTVGLASAIADNVIGVLVSKPQHAGDEATVAVHGVVKIECAAAISAGVAVVTEPNAGGLGRVVASGTGSAGTTVLGYAVHSTANSGELCTVLLRLK